MTAEWGQPWALLTIVLLLVASSCGGADETEAPQVWFGPLDPDGFQYHGVTEFESYDEVFTAGADWQSVSDQIHVAVTYPAFLDGASLEDLERVLGDIADRGLALTFESGPLTETARCNAATVEGFAGAGPIERILRRIDAAGVDLYAFSLEHGFDAATYDLPLCRMTPAEIAADVAGVVDVVHEHFPDALVGSIETADLDVDAVDAWMSAYATAVGTELDFFHLDVAYHRSDWAERAREIEDHVNGRGVPFGIFYFGDESDSADDEWLRKTESRFVEFEIDHGGTPDHVLFQSWHPHPTRLLPEDEPGTFTNLIARYLRRWPTLAVDRSGGGS